VRYESIQERKYTYYYKERGCERNNISAGHRPKRDQRSEFAPVLPTCNDGV
jgi:hypothetical protein